MILYRGGRGPLLAVAVLVAMVTGAAAQQQPGRPQPGVQPQRGVQPQNAGAPVLGRPQPTVGPAGPRPPEPRVSVSGVSPTGSNVFGRKTKAPVLGRPQPTVGPAGPRPPEPRVSVSGVSPTGSNVFGRKTKVGGQSRGITNQQSIQPGVQPLNLRSEEHT